MNCCDDYGRCQQCHGCPARSAPGMRDHSFTCEWRFVVPPANTRRVVISQRQDGPFRSDTTGGQGFYHTSMETLAGGRWEHVPGSATGGHKSYAAAFAVAERAWRAAITKGHAK